MSNILKWIVYSSKDSSKISLMVKGFLTSLVPIIIMVSGLMDVKLESETLTVIIDGIASSVSALLSVVAAISFFWGTVRKIVTTIKGENDVINNKL